MSDRHARIRARAAALLAELQRLVDEDPERLSSVDFAILMVMKIAARARRGERTTLDPRQASILVDGAVELLDTAAAAALDDDDARAACLERELAAAGTRTRPEILH